MAAAMVSDIDKVNPLQRVLESQTNIDHVCWNHLRLLANHCGLRTYKGEIDILSQRLVVFFQRRDSLMELRTDVSAFDWFKRKDRPPAHSDSFGPYQFAPANSLRIMGITIPLCRRLITTLSGDSHIWERWQDEGTVTLDLFSYLWSGIATSAGSEMGIGGMIDEEFRMYRYHQRLIDGKPNFGWQRSMIHSLTQQVIRADIGYWMSYVALRPDGNPWLVSYPYKEMRKAKWE